MKYLNNRSYIRRFAFAFIFCFSAIVHSFAATNLERVRFYNEEADTTRLTEMLREAAGRSFRSSGERVEFFARKFIGTPYVAHTLECDSGEVLTVDLDRLDCTTFVETVMALAMTAGENRSSWRDYVYNLRRIRYRGGRLNGYSSRLHYICDWAVDNKHRGNFSDVTADFPKHSYLIRTIDFMTENRSLYPALADSVQYARMRSIEGGYRNHRFPYVKTIDLKGKDVRAEFMSGDVVGIVTKMKNLDVTHMGIIVRDESDGTIHLLHASSAAGKVELSPLPLYDFMKKNHNSLGLRIFRLQE